MVPLASLVVPIPVSAVIVFVVSSIIHMALPYHRKDFRKLAKQDDVQRNWGVTLKSMFDGSIDALLTAGTFGWLWPRLS